MTRINALTEENSKSALTPPAMEDTARSLPPMNQEAGAHQTPNLPVP